MGNGLWETKNHIMRIMWLKYEIIVQYIMDFLKLKICIPAMNTRIMGYLLTGIEEIVIL